MGRDEAFATFQGCVAEVLDIDPDQVKPEARWAEDLDADSLAVVEITLGPQRRLLDPTARRRPQQAEHRWPGLRHRGRDRRASEQPGWLP